MHKKLRCLLLSLFVIFACVGCVETEQPDYYYDDDIIIIDSTQTSETSNDYVITVATNKTESGYTNITIPAYSGEAYYVVNNGIPFFDSEDLVTDPFEYYSELDELGRCGVAYANICDEIMPAEGEERGEIGQVKPSGWHTATYPDVISDRYLYNRCHLIGWQLAGENANKKNLITGTRYLNIEGMLPFENMVDDYVEEYGHHVLYRVTPYYIGDNLVADGVLIEAQSVEADNLIFCVWCYNVQPYVYIDYATGESYQIETAIPGVDDTPVNKETESEIDIDNMTFDFVLNTNTMKAHDETCTYAQNMSEANRDEFTGTCAELEAMGYELCKNCFGDKD